MNWCNATVFLISTFCVTNCAPVEQDSPTMDVFDQNILSGVAVKIGEARNLMNVATFTDESAWNVPAVNTSGSLSWFGSSSNGVRKSQANLKDLTYLVDDESHHTWTHNRANSRESFSTNAELLLFKGGNIPANKIKFNAKLDFALLPNFRSSAPPDIVGIYPRGWVSITCNYLNANQRQRSIAIATESTPVDQVSGSWISTSVSLISDPLDFADCLSRSNPSISFGFGVSDAYGIKVKDVELQMLDVD